MKKLLLAALLLACAPVHAQLLTKFGPVNGVLVGTVANPQTAAATSANILSLWSGSCSGTTFLNGAGACATPAGVAPTGAANLVYATPNGSTGAATLRALVGADVPPINLGSTANGGVSSATILLGTNGGTSNGFFSVTGPTTALRTFTFPNASATVLTTNAAVTVPQGGTGVATLTGLVKGNGTSAFTAATSADVIALWTGTCSSTTFLRGDGACASAGGGAVGGTSGQIQYNNAGVFGGANEVYSVGSGSILDLQSTNFPSRIWTATGGGTDLKKVQMYYNTSVPAFIGSFTNDAVSAEKIWLQVTRGATTTVSGIQLGNATDSPNLSILSNSSTQTGSGGAGTSAQFQVLNTSTSEADFHATSPVGDICVSSNNRGTAGNCGMPAGTTGIAVPGVMTLHAATSITADATMQIAGGLNFSGTALLGGYGIERATANSTAMVTGGQRAWECNDSTLLCSSSAFQSVMPSFSTLRTASGSSVSCASGAFCNLGSFNTTGNKIALVMCTVVTSGDSANYDSVGIVAVNGSASTMTIIKTGTLMTMQLIATNVVQCKQSSGALANITFAYVEFLG